MMGLGEHQQNCQELCATHPEVFGLGYPFVGTNLKCRDPFPNIRASFSLIGQLLNANSYYELQLWWVKPKDIVAEKRGQVSEVYD